MATRQSYLLKPENGLPFLLNSFGWTILDEHFSLLCNCLPNDYQSTLVKLKRLPQLSNDDHQQLGTMISSSCEAQLINEKIVTFLIVKLCYNGSSDSLVGLCDVMDILIVSKQSIGCVQQVRCALSKNYDLPTSYSTNKLDNTMLTGQALTVLTSGDVVISCATVYSTTGAVVTEVFSTNNSIGASKVGLQTASAPQVSSSCQELTNSERSITANISGHDNTFADPVSFCVTNNRDNIVLTNSTRETELPTIDMPATLPQDFAFAEKSPPMPIKINLNKDFAILKTHYHTILQLMPDNYEQSVWKLQTYISDDQICMILSSSNSITANKLILDCLIEGMSYREELFYLCDQLETITTSHQLMMVITEIRSDLQQSIQFPTSTTSTTNIQSLSSDQQHHSSSPSVNSPLYQMTFSIIKLDPSSRILSVLKKNYTRLWQCLPQDYVKTVHKLKQLIPGIASNYLDLLRLFPSIEMINETIVGNVICLTMEDGNVFLFCDIMETLCEETAPKNQVIEAFRNELLEALCSPPPNTTTGPTNPSLPNNGISSSPGSHHSTTLHQTSSGTSVIGSTHVVSTSLASQPSQGYLPSKITLQEQLSYNHKRSQKGIKCPPPPLLPPNYVCRQSPLNEMVSKLCQSTIDPNSYGTSLTVTGVGGFGKTSIVTALCHHPVIKEQFTDGVVFIELEPQVTDPNMKLRGLYNLLTDKQCDFNVVDKQINQLTSLYCRNLLVIIDDVWHVEDAEPMVKAFSNCKIVLTTRMNDIEQYIPTKQVVSVGPMEQSEAISLLTYGVIEISQLSQEDVSLLDELVQDVNCWPLLLSLIRGQLSHNLKQHKLCSHEAIQFVQAKLHDKGLTAFDKNNIERSRKYAVKICIEMTLELLSKPLLDRLKPLIIWTGIGNSLQTAVLHNLWNITEHEARNVIDVLWAYGLVQFTDVTIPPHNNTQHCVEVHAVISQYIIERVDSIEVKSLLHDGLDTTQSVIDGLTEQFKKSYGIFDRVLCASDYLKYKQCEIEYHYLPIYVKRINMLTIIDPHTTVAILLRIKEFLMTSISITTFFPSLSGELDLLISECHKVLKDAHRLSRTLNKKVQCCLTQRNYHSLIQTIEIYSREYPIAMTAQQAVTIVKKTIPYCDGKLLEIIIRECEFLQAKTGDYDQITLLILPVVKLFIKELQLIHTSLQAGSPDIEATKQYFLSGQHEEEIGLVDSNYLIKLQEVAPNIVNKFIT
ncbi:uncharacterized protein [Dysidea avara]|uniref:uncharacterized protein isoform X2 n=1 Tax=Dysidea avara TaxID=196820 RepID=UPI0033183500